jgi:small subunit ribosomal protein S17
MAKTITGVVASKKTDKTIVVTEHVRLTHPLYRKQYTITKRFMAHDEQNEAREGDKVIIEECRPLSARKHFTLKKIVEKATIKHVEPEAAPVAAEFEAAKAEKPEKEAKPTAAKEETA